MALSSFVLFVFRFERRWRETRLETERTDF